MIWLYLVGIFALLGLWLWLWAYALGASFLALSPPKVSLHAHDCGKNSDTSCG